MRYSRESNYGEILKICRTTLMTEKTFEEVLPTILQILAKGNYDTMTKEVAT